MTNFMSYLNIDTKLTPSTTAGSPSKNVLLIGQRITNGALIQSTNGFQQPNYYIPFLLPSFQNGAAALNYLGNYGLVYQTGINFSLTFPAPDVVTQVGSVTTVTWNTIPSNFTTLLGFVLSGTLSQLAVNATVRSAQIVAGTAVLTVNGAPAFVEAGDAGDEMILAGLNNVIYPDPNASDPIALMAWDFYQTYLSAKNSAQGSPAAYLSILSDRDESVNANATPFPLVAPASVSAKVNNAQTLTYATDENNLGYLPTTTYGATTLSQSIALPTNSTNFVYFANGKYIRGSAAGAGLDYSLDGITWTASNTTSGTFTSAFWNGTRYCASSTVGIYYSADGITWTISTGAATGVFNFVTYANTKWVGLSTVGIYYSTDGITWTISTGAATGIFRQAAFGGTTWIASCSVDLYASTDGITWAALSVSADGFKAVTYADGLFVVGSDGSGTDGLMYSSDGATFIATNIAVNSYDRITFNDTDWVAASDAGLYYSSNGITWTLASGTSTNAYSDVIFANSNWVATSDAGIYSSADSITWAVTNITTGTYTTVSYGTNLFIAGGTTGIKSSIDGDTWSSNNTASGTYQGYEISGANLVISLSDITGTFTNTNTVSVVLDNTISVFNFLDGIDLNGGVNQFPVTTLNDIDVVQAAFFDGITGLNEPDQVLNGHYFTYGYSGNITSLPSSAATLPSPNDQNYVLVSYPYVAKFGDIPYENTAGNVAAARFCAGTSYMIANGDAPFPALLKAVIKHFPVSSVAATTSYSNAAGSTGNIAVEQGWLPLAPNSEGVVSFLQSNTTMITIPGTTVPDTEFRYTHIWDCVRWLKYNVAQLYEVISVLPDNAGTVDITPQFIRQFRTGIISILNTGERLGVVKDVELYQGLVSVTEDDENANQVDAYIPSQMIPQLNGANILINVFSALYNFTKNK